jgi:predicted transcriptional regulator
MPVITIRISRRESTRIARLAKQRKVTRSRLVRDALAGLPDDEAASAYDDWKDTEGLIRSGVRDLATHPKHLKGLGAWRK